MYKIRIHRKEPTKRNPYVVVAVFVDDTGSYGAFRRFFKYRKIDPAYILERDMVTEEIEFTKRCWRLYTSMYTTWVALIQDEWNITQDLAWIEALWLQSGLSEPYLRIIKNLK